MLSFSRVVVIGCGGIGSCFLGPLLRFLAAEKFDGEVALWDGDMYEEKNLVRQMFPSDGTDQFKSAVQAEYYAFQFPLLNIQPHTEYVGDDNIEQAVVENDLVLMGVDNHPARARVMRRMGKLRSGAVISAGNEEYTGEAFVYWRRGGRDMTPNMEVIHPEIGKDAPERDPSAGCEAIIADGGTQYLVTNLTAATCLFLAFHKLWTLENINTDKWPAEVFFDVRQLKITADMRSSRVRA